jgi:hypothetical protein
MFTMIRKRRQAAADWNRKAASARIGEVWTSGYITRQAVMGGQYQSYEVAAVDRPANGANTQDRFVGEMNLDRRLTPGWFSIYPSPFAGFVLEKGDVAPTVAAGTAADLLAVAAGQMVTVEHRAGNVRSVDIGQAWDVTDFCDGEGPGRYVGDTWVCLSEVTGVERS